MLLVNEARESNPAARCTTGLQLLPELDAWDLDGPAPPHVEDQHHDAESTEQEPCRRDQAHGQQHAPGRGRSEASPKCVSSARRRHCFRSTEMHSTVRGWALSMYMRRAHR